MLERAKIYEPHSLNTRENLNDVLRFPVPSRGNRSFTRRRRSSAFSQSALSHTIRGLEARLGSTSAPNTRSVAPTESGANACSERLDRVSTRSRPSGGGE